VLFDIAVVLFCKNTEITDNCGVDEKLILEIDDKKFGRR
jgi:hypothetical protein